MLLDSVAQARFVLIGESHFSREIPMITAAVCRAMHPDAYAVEAGPSAASYVNSMLHSSERQSDLRKRERAYPANMAFLNGEQENDLAASCAAASLNDRFAVWGLDQEFLGATPVLLQKMCAERNGPKASKAILEAIAKDRLAEADARLSGDLTQLFLMSASDNDVLSLKSAVDVDGSTESLRLLDELMVSREIYRLNRAGSPDSNRQRAALLKQHFLARYRAAAAVTPAPRVLLKFGDNHMAKGFNDLHQLDLGNFVAEFAAGEGASSVHLMIIAARGTLPSFTGYARPLRSESFDLRAELDTAWLAPAIDLLPPVKPSEYGNADVYGVVVDLRSLRFRKLQMTQPWEHLVYGYDLLIVLPSYSPANLLE